MIISLHAKGDDVRDIQHHLQSTIGSELSHETMQHHRGRRRRVQGLAEPGCWTRSIRSCSLAAVDRDGPRWPHRPEQGRPHRRRDDIDGIKHVLGIWVQARQGAKFWAGVCAELANRGVRDVLIACCDGLSGLPEAIKVTWPNTVVQTILCQPCGRRLRRSARRRRPSHGAGGRTVGRLLRHCSPKSSVNPFASADKPIRCKLLQVMRPVVMASAQMRGTGCWRWHAGWQDVVN
jgi:putative transposase